MVSGEEPAASVYGHKLSTVSTGSVTGEDVVHELTNMDLIMKHHYFRVVYYFKPSDIIDELNIIKLKGPMFPVLDLYYPVTGRIRRIATGRPLIKCNDCGVRIVEAMCNKTLDEWLETKDSARWRQLVSDKVLGPELHFSPTIYVQVTKFKCGGMSIGYSWAHILGDAISAINLFNMWGLIISGNPPPKSIQLRDFPSQKETSEKQEPMLVKPLTVKEVEPIGEHWLIPNSSKLSTFVFQITDTKLKSLQPEELKQVQPFEIISALVWYCIAKIRVGKEPKVVTICRYDTSSKRTVALANDLKIGSVSVHSSPAVTGYKKLATLISKQEIDESKAVQGLIDENTGKPDFLLYGANLTFIDMQGVEFHGLELKGQNPIQIDCSIDGVGDEGSVMVFNNLQMSVGTTENSGKTVVLILPEYQIPELEVILQSEFSLA